MGFGKIAINTVKYGAAFLLGYWVAGGCDPIKPSQNQLDYNKTSIEGKLDNYESRLDNLEYKLEGNKK
jgi:hypothetical protein